MAAKKTTTKKATKTKVAPKKAAAKPAGRKQTAVKKAAAKKGDKTMSALDGVFKSAGGDSRKAFRSYSTEVASFSTRVAEMRSRVSDLHAHAGGYFDLWRKQAAQIQRSTLRRRALPGSKAE